MKIFLTALIFLFLAGISYAEPIELYVQSVHADTLVAVEFQCNMSVQMLKGAFDPATDTLFISGSFNDWSPQIMSDPDLDSLYTVTLNVDSAGNTIEFKYRFFDYSAGTMMWEGVANRSYVVPDYPSVYYAWFNNDSIYVPQYDISVTFMCNMELERLSGRFDPATDTVSVNGDFNGWASKVTIMQPQPLDPDVYEATTTIRRGVGETIQFKFWYTDNNWESVDNRVYTFTQEDINNLTAEYSASFNNGTLETVLNQPCTITFTLNTEGARSAITGQPFPVVNTVHLFGSALPLQWPQGGWPDEDSVLGIPLSHGLYKMYDDGTHGDVQGGDQIFTAVVTFPAYTVLDVQFKYGINYGDALNNEGGNDNEAGFAQNHILNMTRFMSSATATDTFGTMGVSDLSNVVGVEENIQIPTVYSLSQNYPNPFNPSTKIEYELPEESFVTLKIYNVLGQEVAILVNEKQPAGTYTTAFDASKLPSGIYFYKLTAGDFVSTKKMMLLK